jgi:multimeric flavodoxin WrbA
MNKNILIIIGSPRNQKSNSNIIANSLENKLIDKNLNCSKLYLGESINENDSLIKDLDKSDVIVLISPIYENSVPSIVLKLFETAYENKETLMTKSRKMVVITNSGYPEVEASKSAIKTCSLFAQAMDFVWLCGITVAPGTLMDSSKELEKTGNTYKKLISALNLISEDIFKDREISTEVFKLISKPFMIPFIYRLGGRMMQNKVIKNLGKDNYFSMPLTDSIK